MAAGEYDGLTSGRYKRLQTLKSQESAAGDGLEAAVADAQLQRDCQQRLAALVGVLRADHLQVAPARIEILATDNVCHAAALQSRHVLGTDHLQVAPDWHNSNQQLL